MMLSEHKWPRAHRHRHDILQTSKGLPYLEYLASQMLRGVEQIDKIKHGNISHQTTLPQIPHLLKVERYHVTGGVNIYFLLSVNGSFLFR
jgi:hypothetical protein